MLLDVGCGTGVLLAALFDKCPQATLMGLDPVPGMLRVARKRLSPEIGLTEARAETLPFADAVFDVVVSCSVFHYIRQPQKALCEIRRVLRPGGQVVLTDWCADYLTCRILYRYLRLRGMSCHRVYQRAELLDLFRRAGFANLQGERYKINWLWGLMTVRATKPL